MIPQDPIYVLKERASAERIGLIISSINLLVLLAPFLLAVLTRDSGGQATAGAGA